MTESDSSAVLSPAERRSFISRKLFSLSGVVPIGAFFVMHLWTYSSALGGRHAFERAYEAEGHTPYRWLVAGLLIWLPLLFHGIYGVVLSFGARANLKSYPYARNFGYVLQRLSGLVVLVFLGYHAWEYPLQIALGRLEQADLFSKMCGSFSSTGPGGIPFIAVSYLIGIAAACYHLANGLTNFCFSWGITSTRRASRRVAGAMGLLAIGLFALGANSIIYFATGSRLVLAPSHDPGQAPPITCQDLDAHPTARANMPTHALLATHAEPPGERGRP